MKKEQTATNRKQTIIFTAESPRLLRGKLRTQRTEKQIRLTTENTEKRKEKILELKNNRQRRVLKKRAQRKTYQKSKLKTKRWE